MHSCYEMSLRLNIDINYCSRLMWCM